MLAIISICFRNREHGRALGPAGGLREHPTGRFVSVQQHRLQQQLYYVFPDGVRRPRRHFDISEYFLRCEHGWLK